MKIRIRGNTVRYRLSKSEVIILAKEGMLQERTEFVSDTLTYAIQQTNTNNLSADFSNNQITLFIPKATLHTWATTAQVGIQHTMQLPGGNTLYLLLEKDFKCIDAEVTEDQSDNFDNPHYTC